MFRMPIRRPVASVPVCVLVVLALAALAPKGALAQPFVGTEPGIVADGFGRATAPASSASLQFLIGPNQSAMMGGPLAAVTPDQPDPIVQALVDAGAAVDDIDVTVLSVAGGFFGPGGPEIGETRVTIRRPERGQLADLALAVRNASN